MAALLAKGKFTPPGRTGMFGNLAFSHSLIHQIGGQDDTNRNTTQRMLLLLESQAINRMEAYERVIRGIIKRYLENGFRSFRLKVPRFLLNDVHRFWRTMCVDYASKYRERAGDGWAIRNVKLQMSRKLIFAAGLITCFSCDPDWVAERDAELARQPAVDGMVDYLVTFVHRTPLEIVSEVLLHHPEPDTAGTLLDIYDRFLAQLDDNTVREQLQRLAPDAAATDTKFSEIQRECRRFEEALEKIFFDENPRLARLTRKYGVF
ncbi:MAG: nucleotidyltransferase domain-containing protein [Acidobacteria bacterium]|nr:nucleotidyltransferase domain-containing protein [Acidobacteriota bacterium]